MGLRRWFVACLLLAGLASLPQSTAPIGLARAARGCPAEMVRVRNFCVDRWEISTVDSARGQPLSPYYPPEPKLLHGIRLNWEIERRNVGDARARELPLPALPEAQLMRTDYKPRAVSRSGQIPQAYLSYGLAKRACEAAGKRLCTEEEWITACEGRQARKFPYGETFEAGRCNVYRLLHPAAVLHAGAWYGHRDPRLNLVTDPVEGPLLRLTGGTPGCSSAWEDDQIFDMVGNVDEWVESDPESDIGLFLGGFYARSTREGCRARVSNHAKLYYDYSTGARCCRSL